jgi:hypothetical protein
MGGPRGQRSRETARLCGLPRKIEVHPDGVHQQKRGGEQHRPRDREPSIVAVLTKKTSHVSPIGA